MFVKLKNNPENWLQISREIEGKNIGISGGSAGKILSFLQTSANLDLFLVDERNVDIDSEYSNCKLLQQFNPNLKINCLYHSPSELPERLDTVIMGVGSDGHIASLFGLDDLSLTGDIVQTKTELHDVKERTSLSFDYLLKSKKIIFILVGESKGKIFENMQNKKETDLVINQFLSTYTGCLKVFYLN